MAVRFFRDNDADSCIEIWKKSFVRDADFAGEYFNNIHPLSKSYVCEHNGSVVGYLALFPFDASVCGQSEKCGYIYGVCVHPDYRGLGYMSDLMHRVIDDNDCFFVLVPALEGLYERFGFTDFSPKVMDSIKNPAGVSNECYDIEFLNYVYDEFRKKYDISLARSRKWWEIVLKTALDDGFRVLANEGAYAFIRNQKITEFAYVSEYYKTRLEVGCAEIFLPQSMSYGVNSGGKNYLALMLD